MRSLAMSWNPIIGLPEAIVLAAIFLVAGAALAWGNSGGVTKGLRGGLFALRLGGLIALALIWLNPGHWQQPKDTTQREWVMLVDRSRSMQAEQAPGQSRWEAGAEVAKVLRAKSESGDKLSIQPFAASLEEPTEALSALAPDGNGTDIGRAVSGVLDRPQSAAGIILISDGRATNRLKPDELGRRARGRGIPIHAVGLGETWGNRDLIVSAMPRKVAAFRGQPVKLGAEVENRGLGPIKPTVTLIGPDGKEIARKEVALDQNAPGNRAIIPFELPPISDRGGDFTFRVDAWPGEHIPGNNSAITRVDVLDSKTRVLLLEGAPYWDSKFLAQLLRQQGAVEILTVHRLNEERYFRVEAKGAEPLQSPDSVFPRTAEELRRYDLIVFGKGADGFLDAARAEAVMGFVRDQGGAVLFARGKPYGGRFAPLEALESVEWGENVGAATRLVPLTDESAGLFGGALPGADDRIWSSLPTLEGSHHVTKLKPFTRVLAEAALPGKQLRVPLLTARRYGRGMVATVNADGLWRWDFRADAAGTVYQDFWVQLMQWCATFSDFRPGQDYAVRMRETSVEANQPTRAIIAYRGTGDPAPKPGLLVTQGGKTITQVAGTALPESDGGREWAAVLSLPDPGRYDIRVIDEARPGKQDGEAMLTVEAPAQEADDFRPNRELLATLARESGGKLWTIAEAQQLAAEMSTPKNALTAAKPNWEPLWPQWWVAILVGAFFGGEWWLRRREGLW